MPILNGYWSEVVSSRVFTPVGGGSTGNMELHFVPLLSSDHSVVLPIAHVSYQISQNYPDWGTFLSMLIVYNNVSQDWVYTFNGVSSVWGTMTPDSTFNFTVVDTATVDPASLVRVYWRMRADFSMISQAGTNKTFRAWFSPATDLFANPDLCRAQIAKISYGVVGSAYYNGGMSTGEYPDYNGYLFTFQYDAITDRWFTDLVTPLMNNGDYYTIVPTGEYRYPLVYTPVVVNDPIEVVIVPEVVPNAVYQYLVCLVIE
ncbi:MAG: hypothetical protein JWP81_1181 [Ferruginibacter sp.]|nr:hypothetical protein [Ferruginibacter sp.]